MAAHPRADCNGGGVSPRPHQCDQARSKQSAAAQHRRDQDRGGRGRGNGATVADPERERQLHLARCPPARCRSSSANAARAPPSGHAGRQPHASDLPQAWFTNRPSCLLSLPSPLPHCCRPSPGSMRRCPAASRSVPKSKLMSRI